MTKLRRGDWHRDRSRVSDRDTSSTQKGNRKRYKHQKARVSTSRDSSSRQNEYESSMSSETSESDERPAPKLLTAARAAQIVQGKRRRPRLASPDMSGSEDESKETIGLSPLRKKSKVGTSQKEGASTSADTKKSSAKKDKQPQAINLLSSSSSGSEDSDASTRSQQRSFRGHKKPSAKKPSTRGQNRENEAIKNQLDQQWSEKVSYSDIMAQEEELRRIERAKRQQKGNPAPSKPSAAPSKPSVPPLKSSAPKKEKKKAKKPTKLARKSLARKSVAKKHPVEDEKEDYEETPMAVEERTHPKTGKKSMKRDSMSVSVEQSLTSDKQKHPILHPTAWRCLKSNVVPRNILPDGDDIDPPFSKKNNYALTDFDDSGDVADICRFVSRAEMDPSMKEDDMDDRIRNVIDVQLPMLEELKTKRTKALIQIARKQIRHYKGLGCGLKVDDGRSEMSVNDVSAGIQALDIHPSERIIAHRLQHTPPPAQAVEQLENTRFTHGEAVDGNPYKIKKTVPTLMEGDMHVLRTPIERMRKGSAYAGIRTSLYVEDYKPGKPRVDPELVSNDAYGFADMEEEFLEYLLRAVVSCCGRNDMTFAGIQRVMCLRKPGKWYEELEEWHYLTKKSRKRIYEVKERWTSLPTSIQKLASQLWYINSDSSRYSLEHRLSPPPPFRSSYLANSKNFGLRQAVDYDGLVGYTRSFLCRRCYVYNCQNHGIDFALPKKRSTPAYPVLHKFNLRLNKPVVEDDHYSFLSKGTDAVEVRDSDSDEQQDTAPIARRQSSRSLTQVSSRATASVVAQEVQEKTYRYQQEIAKKQKRLKLVRSTNADEYLDGSYGPMVKRHLEHVQVDAPFCSTYCYKKDMSVGLSVAALNDVEKVLIQKLAQVMMGNACAISMLLTSNRCDCATVHRFIQENANTIQASILSTLTSTKQRTGHAKTGSIKSVDAKVAHRYVPCNHNGPCGKCSCNERGHYCERACACPRDCSNRFRGCVCELGQCGGEMCPCFRAGRECDPDYCWSCGATDAAVMHLVDGMKELTMKEARVCQNVNMLRHQHKLVRVAFSDTHGLGAFAAEGIPKGDFVWEYVGELVSDAEADRRGEVYKKDDAQRSYLYDVSLEEVVDAMRKGNKAKFANHMKDPEANLTPRLMRVRGENRIAMFANRAIACGDELFFNYNYSQSSAPTWGKEDGQREESLETME